MAKDPVTVSKSAFELQEICEVVTNGEVCNQPNPFQPSKNEMSYSNKVFNAKDVDNGIEIDRQFSILSLNSELVIGGIPYTKYWQNKHNNYIFHPMRFGRYISKIMENNEWRNLFPEIVRKIGIRLPNNSIAFYYPKYYSLGRMKGPDLTYSAISQAEILAGVIRYDQLEKSTESKKLVNAIKESLFFPYEQGGVELAGIAQLEIPLFRGNPEIVLNGWLHALIHLNDFAILYKDSKTRDYIRESLKFFADNYQAWYDEQRNISLYSDTSPHRVFLKVKKKVDTPKLFVVYQAKDKKLPNYIFELGEDEGEKYSLFDNKIYAIETKSNRFRMTLNCSRLYETKVVSSDSFTLSVRDGGYSPTGSAPDGVGGRWNDIESFKIRNGMYEVDFKLKDRELICGYPTNFAKYTGKNYYHVYHIVALLYLALTPSFDDVELSRKVTSIALEWWGRTKDFKNRPYSDFENPDVILKGINEGKILKTIPSASELFRQATSSLKSFRKL